MKKLPLVAAVALAALSLSAQVKRDPVAEGFVDWIGAVDKNQLSGRNLCPSDLRHKFVIVIEVDGKDEAALRKQLLAAAPFVQRHFYQSSHHSVAWEHHELARDPFVVVSSFGTKDPEVYRAALKSSDQNDSRALTNYASSLIPVYSALTYAGAADNAGKRPFVYLMGVNGVEPLASGPADRTTLDQVTKAIRTEKAKLKSDGWIWLPFTGSIEEPQHYKALKKTITSKKPKPLTADMAKIKRGIASKKPEVAKESQILYDALEQMRSDLVFRIRAEAAACPHRAAYDIQQLLKYWPTEKKRIGDYAEKIKSIPEAGMLARVFIQMMDMADPEFVPKNVGEAKKLVAELGKCKKLLEKLKDSKNVVVQNGASLLDAEIDELISSLPSRVPEK